MKGFTQLVVAFVLLLGTVLTSFAGDLVVPGTGDGVAVLAALSAEFEKSTGTRVEFPKSIGSSGGIVSAGTGQSEVSRVARKPKGKELEFALSYKPVFNIPTVFYVTKDVTIKSLTPAQLLDVFSGKITNWSSVGGENKDIKVIARELGDSSWDNLKETFPNFRDISFSNKAIIARKTPDMLLIMAHEKSAIGFGPLDVAIENNIKYISVDGISAKSKDYPYKGTIGLVYKNESLSSDAKKFLQFVDTNMASSIIADFGGTPL